MFGLLNLLGNVVQLTGKALGISLYLLADVHLPMQLDTVTTVEMSTAAPVLFRVRPKTDEEQCRYSGLIVPYEQLWEERTTNAFGIETVTPPQPGTIAGYAVIINRKDCEGRDPEAMLRVNTFNRKWEKIQLGYNFWMMPPEAMPEEARPKWLAQVAEKVPDIAEKQSIAKDFLRFNEEHSRTDVTAAKSD